ncbi:MAG: hypothetical protein HFF54_03910 [Lawsonibacter sp.]|jgi:hypothetical protein|nr:hypothetical protein [Lawsonibacter sp.]
MANRILRWFGFSIGLMVLPVLLSIIMRKVLGFPVIFESYSSEILFMAVTLSATSIGDIVSLIERQVTGVHITILLIVLIFISLICVSIYEIISMSEILELEINTSIINLLTAIGGISSVITGTACQVFLSKVVD